jgi:hypothetical protein
LAVGAVFPSSLPLALSGSCGAARSGGCAHTSITMKRSKPWVWRTSRCPRNLDLVPWNPPGPRTSAR